MYRQRTLIIASIVIAAALGQGFTFAQPELKTVMKVKLAYTQLILEGLALEDFDKVKRGAENLATLSRADAWNVHKTPEYVKFSKDFQELADALAKDAAAKKLEACTLDYVQLTMLCVKCHTHTRKIGVASNDVPLRELLAQVK